ncbi:MAG: hypothetical protein KIS66_07455 [Fimbriimonadaceae bacterium]|nr:hypothetical protein [Fimbriimonadaceae bacterium]
MRVFFSAGEASGDAYAAALIEAIRARVPEVAVEGVGGKRFARTGSVVVAESSQWGSIGVVKAVGVLPRVLVGYVRAKRRLSRGSPGVCVPIDFGAMNIKLARFAKARGWKVLYFAPPGSWRKDRQGKDLPRITHEVVTQFSWSADLLTQAGAKAHWFGHPLKEMVARRLAEGPAVPRDPNRIAVLAGSRLHEIEHTLRVVARVAERLAPATVLEFAVAPTIDPDAFRRKWEDLAPGRRLDLFTADDTYGVFLRAQAAIVCSGTATLEAALCGCPCVVVYVVSKAMEFEYHLLRPKFDYVSLPNILLGRPLLKELLQHDATPERIADEIEALRDGPRRGELLAAFAELENLLGPPEGIARAADRIVALGRDGYSDGLQAQPGASQPGASGLLLADSDDPEDGR